MKKLLTLLLLTMSAVVVGQEEKAYGAGEWFKFRVHYGFVTAGYATLEVNDAKIDGKEVYHVKGEGRTTGVSKWFFRVEDYYQSFIDKEKDIPYRFIRKIDEGGYTKDIQIDFDHDSSKALIKNFKKDTEEMVDFPSQAQDMISSFYYLRNYLDTENLKEGDIMEMNMFFDRENFRFRMKFLGRETLRTKFGKVPCLIFRPYVEAGRVFEEKESLTVWVTDDGNKMPMLIKASLAVGSLKATLTEFKGLKHSFRIVVD